MSRIGKLPVKIPAKVKVDITDNNQIIVKGPFGELSRNIPDGVSLSIKDDRVIVTKTEDTRFNRQKHGLVRSLVNNMVIGVAKKFEIQLQMIGVGYRAQVQGKNLNLNIGFSHPVVFTIPDSIEIAIEANTNLTIRGIDKEQVGLIASQIRAMRPPEPYKGKGIRYTNEIVLRKAGKSGK
uniref:Large ribosomal subunit protein uL6c n=1 Tax=Rhizochromulina marina TaxID=1034831 RepID=A0A514CPX2_9STRA|nr:ribosomal protein L6 [Rhizochromulina marina]QDH81827.1 ribosomal protein L6 [Rhizochromulina marina]